MRVILDFVNQVKENNAFFKLWNIFRKTEVHKIKDNFHILQIFTLSNFLPALISGSRKPNIRRFRKAREKKKSYTCNLVHCLTGKISRRGFRRREKKKSRQQTSSFGCFLERCYTGIKTQSKGKKVSFLKR